MPLNLLQKIEPENFPFHVVKSDDGDGNLVAYDSGNPTNGWIAPMATPFNGLWVRVEFSDYHVNFKHNGTTWVEYNKEAKSSGSTIAIINGQEIQLNETIGGKQGYLIRFEFSDSDLVASSNSPYYYALLNYNPTTNTIYRFIGYSESISGGVTQIQDFKAGLNGYVLGITPFVPESTANTICVNTVIGFGTGNYKLEIYYTKN